VIQKVIIGHIQAGDIAARPGYDRMRHNGFVHPRR